MNRITKLLLALAFSMAFLVLSQTVRAATITVTTTQDEQSVNGSCSLREAVRAANSDQAVDACPAGSGADTIIVPAGDYALTLLEPNPVAGLRNSLEISSAVTLLGSDRDDTLIRGISCRAIQCFTENRIVYVGSAAILKLRNVTLSENWYRPFPSSLIASGDPEGHIQASAVTAHDGAPGFEPRLRDTEHALSQTDAACDINSQGGGGGILNTGVLVLENSRITSASAARGGAIFNCGDLTMRASEITANTAYYYLGPYLLGDGGGIYNTGTSVWIEDSNISFNESENVGGLLSIRGTLDIRGSTLRANTAKTVGGVRSTGVLTLANSLVAGNVATGGIDKYFGPFPGNCAGVDTGSATIINSKIESNLATVARDRFTQALRPSVGGGLCLYGDTTIGQSTISGNSASIGGGLAVFSGKVTLSGVALIQNTALYGAGLEISAGSVTINNTTIAANTALSESGGLRVSGGVIGLNYTTIASNTAPVASNLHVLTGTAAITDSLIANPAGSPNCVMVNGLFISGGHNLSSDASCTLFTASGDLTNTNPLLGPLKINPPGATPILGLLPGSPAINAGDAVPNQSVLCDQRGIPRAWGGP